MKPKVLRLHQQDKDAGLQSQTMKITPKMARQWLEYNSRNRSLSKNQTLRLMRDMKNEKWLLGVGTIIFDWDGVLVDGQHRLHACAMSDTTFVSIVVTGADPAIRVAVDKNRSRSGADMLTLQHGEKNATQLSAILAMIWRLERETLSQNSDVPSNAELEEMLDKHPDARRSAHLSAQLAWKRMGRPSVLGFCHWAFSKKDDTLADSFFEDVTTGELMRAKEPQFQLRERLISNRGASKKMTQKEILGLTIKAWNMVRSGKKVRILSFKVKQEKIPEIE